MEVFACVAGTDVRVAVETSPDGTVGSLQAKAVSCLRAEGHVLRHVWLRLPGSSECLGAADTLLQDTPLENGAAVEVVLGNPHVARSELFGVGEGVPFDDCEKVLSWGRVVCIDVEPGKKGLALTYANGARLVYGEVRLASQRVPRIVLAEDEYVTGVSGWCGSTLEEITFVTNKRVCGAHGSHTEQDAAYFSVSFTEGMQLLYLYGRASTQCVTQIGFGSGQPVEVPLVHRTELRAPGLYLSGVNNDNSTELVHLHSRICGLSVWVNTDNTDVRNRTVIGVGVAYTDGTYLRHMLNSRGQIQNLELHTVAFDDDEFVSGIQTVVTSRFATSPLQQITFTTNKRTIGPFGTLSDDTVTFDDTFDGELLFVFSQPPDLGFGPYLGFGHGQPPTPTDTTARTLSKQDVERTMRICEEDMKGSQSSPLKCHLPDFLGRRRAPVPRALRGHSGGTGRAAKVTGTNTSCQCPIC
eukprot:TRINITY_DN958_c1_g1_i7.p1 TRINITY_DN958_c1_g1~~TRINITY_DN958_c1_g1_i7.p1  ORF type:complete len:478 (+),score=97.71 TRINITY_DN958_c1_g1_i7:28-1434(+)